jgi:hypothetical protein
MRPKLESEYPLLTSRTAVEFVRTKTGAPLTLSRFHKDRMNGLAPEPVATFGNRDLFTEAQMLEYGRTLIKPVEARQSCARLTSRTGDVPSPLDRTIRRIGSAPRR